MRLLRNFILVFFLSLYSIAVSAQFWEALLEPLFVEGFWYTFIGSPDEPRWYETTFAAYPYDLQESGLFLPTDLEGDKSRGQIALHFQNDEKSISGGFFQAKYAPISLFTIEAYRLQLFDNQKADRSENIKITGFNANYNRLRHHKIHAWWGLGGVWMDADENSSSPSFNMGANYFFKDPLSLYGTIQFARLNEQLATLGELRIQVHLRRFLLYGGYHSFQNGDLSISSWTIGGGIYF